MYHYDVEGRLIAEFHQNGAMQKRYTWLNGELIGVLAGDELFFVHANYRNEPWLVTGPDGAVIWQNLTSPFGNSAETYPKVAETHQRLTLNLRLAGQYYDAETGYYYNYMRDYSPELGRYLQADPIGLKGGMNLYAYCSGDPVNRRDELGLWYEGDGGPGGIGGVGAEDDEDEGGWGGGPQESHGNSTGEADDDPWGGGSNETYTGETIEVTLEEEDLSQSKRANASVGGDYFNDSYFDTSQYTDSLFGADPFGPPDSITTPSGYSISQNDLATYGGTLSTLENPDLGFNLETEIDPLYGLDLTLENTPISKGLTDNKKKDLWDVLFDDIAKTIRMKLDADLAIRQHLIDKTKKYKNRYRI